LLYGIKKSNIFKEIELIEDYPANVAQMILDGTADVGLVPVAVIPNLSVSHIITDYCIGCDGAVASVCIFSDVPMDQIEKVYLDYQSRTSVSLANILLKEYWNSNAQLIDATGEDYRAEIQGTTAGLIIGDRALVQRLKSKYVYDLGEAWKAHTGLPFVFAAWVSNKKLSERFIEDFNKANREGLVNLSSVINENPFPFFNIEGYFTRYISYQLTERKREGLRLFFNKLKPWSSGK
jgi:chorismate dehydratase